MRIGIMGSGEVATTLAAGFAKHGHAVTIGARTPAKLAEWGAQHPEIRIATLAAAAAFGELLVLAVKASAAAEALQLAGTSALAGKLVIDTTNPVTDAPPVNGVLSFYTPMNESAMESLQRQFPSLRFVKAFNSVGAEFMVDPRFEGGPPTMFICGNDAAARQSVAAILQQFGWEVADMGAAEAARAIEPLCLLWCIPGFLRNEWSHAFKLLRS
jgi:8-hydroxy-5-deazaflavin:NADPH oxidoreductase